MLKVNTSLCYHLGVYLDYMKITDWRQWLLSFTGLRRLVQKPVYAAMILLIALLFAVAIYGLININFYGPLLLSALPITDKFRLLGQLILALFHDTATGTGLLIILISLLQGAAITAIIFDIKHNRTSDKELASRTSAASGISAVAAALGLGCVPCGTSLILPIVALFFSGAAATTAANIANGLVLIAALVLSVWSLVRAGYVVYIHTELTPQEESYA